MPRVSNNTKLISIRVFHTAIWAFYVAVLGFMVYAGVSDKIDVRLLVCVALVVVEGIILVVFKWRCPLTVLAERYCDNPEIGFDIYLPQFVARHNKNIYLVLFSLSLLIVLARLILE